MGVLMTKYELQGLTDSELDGRLFQLIEYLPSYHKNIDSREVDLEWGERDRRTFYENYNNHLDALIKANQEHERRHGRLYYQGDIRSIGRK